MARHFKNEHARRQFDRGEITHDEATKNVPTRRVVPYFGPPPKRTQHRESARRLRQRQARSCDKDAAQ